METTSISELKEIVASTLESKGVLNTIRAQLRAAVYTAIDDQERSQGIYRENKRFRAFLGKNEASQCIGLIREFLEFFDMDCSLSVFLPEADQKIEDPIDRTQLCEELGISDEEDFSIAKGTPLLFRLIQKLQTQDPPSSNKKEDKMFNNTQNSLSTTASNLNNLNLSQREVSPRVSVPNPVPYTSLLSTSPPPITKRDDDSPAPSLPLSKVKGDDTFLSKKVSFSDVINQNEFDVNDISDADVSDEAVERSHPAPKPIISSSLPALTERKSWSSLPPVDNKKATFSPPKSMSDSEVFVLNSYQIINKGEDSLGSLSNEMKKIHDVEAKLLEIEKLDSTGELKNIRKEVEKKGTPLVSETKKEESEDNYDNDFEEDEIPEEVDESADLSTAESDSFGDHEVSTSLYKSYSHSVDDMHALDDWDYSESVKNKTK